ncbi:MAG: hypothetical protein K9K81_09380, partial [Desulfobacteraceae bacterium]|nr:hypothetical protein [Desulfobacteraceae bacterium]
LNELVKLVGRVQGKDVRIYRFPWIEPIYFLAYIMELASKPFDFEPPIFRRRLSWFTINRGWDISRAKTDLGFRPRVSLSQGLAQSMKWYQGRGFL